MCVQKQSQQINGVDVSALKKMCATVKEKPNRAKSLFRVHNAWEHETRNITEVNSYYIEDKEHKREDAFTPEIDEVPILLGSDQELNSFEYLLTALISCMTILIIYYAVERKIHIQSLESNVEGVLNLLGFWGVDKSVPKGYQKREVTFKIQTDASTEEIAELYRFSPVYSVILQSVPVEVQIIDK